MRNINISKIFNIILIILVVVLFLIGTGFTIINVYPPAKTAYCDRFQIEKCMTVEEIIENPVAPKPESDPLAPEVKQLLLEKWAVRDFGDLLYIDKKDLRGLIYIMYDDAPGSIYVELDVSTSPDFINFPNMDKLAQDILDAVRDELPGLKHVYTKTETRGWRGGYFGEAWR
ncbi:MAG: hypothetical protein LBN03_00425 [Bifidobacteriaceae bacterium]|jgi:hypothetical protein|nr:hypothetical protein [Bifidobacteriaceae bacterium]